jgi:hypothetical protein
MFGLVFWAGPMSLLPHRYLLPKPRAATRRSQRGKFPIGAGSTPIDFCAGCATVLYGDKDGETAPAKT